MGFSWTLTAAVVTVAMMLAGAGVAEGQNDCVSQLVTCAPYLNSTSPSRECCNAIQQVVRTQLTCLCALYNNPQALGGINMTQALQIPVHCNLSSNTNICNHASAPGASTTHPPPPGVAGGRDRNGASMSSWMGMPTLLLVSAFTFLY